MNESYFCSLIGCGWENATQWDQVKLYMACSDSEWCSSSDPMGIILICVGILLGLLGSIFINVGNNMQALGMHKEEAAGSDAAKKKSGACIKIAGTVLFIGGSVINFTAFALAAASVLAPLEAVQFVSNLIFARLVTKTAISKKMVLGSVFIVGGTVAAVGSGPMSVYSFDIETLVGFWTVPAWIVYVIFANTMALATQALWLYHQTALDRGEPKRNFATILPVTYALTSALVGTQSVVQAKCISELLELWMGGVCMIWGEWYTYFVLVLFLATVGFWLYRLNAALGKYDPLFIIPLLQASYIVFATVAGGIYFREFETFAWWQLALFIAAICVMFCGLVMLMPPNKAAEGEADHIELRDSLKQNFDGTAAPAAAGGAAPVSEKKFSDSVMLTSERAASLRGGLAAAMAIEKMKSKPSAKALEALGASDSLGADSAGGGAPKSRKQSLTLSATSCFQHSESAARADAAADGGDAPKQKLSKRSIEVLATAQHL